MFQRSLASPKTPTIESLQQIWSHSKHQDGHPSEMSWIDVASQAQLHLQVKSYSSSIDPVWVLQLQSGNDMVTLGTLISSDLDTVMEFVSKHFRNDRYPSNNVNHGQSNITFNLRHHRPKQKAALPLTWRTRLAGPDVVAKDHAGCTGAPESVGHSVPMELAMQFERGLTDPETGALSISAFLFFLRHEFDRLAHNGAPFALLLLSMQIGTKNAEEALPGITCEVVERIHKVKRTSDFLADFGASELILLLHDTDSKGAALMAKRIDNAVHYPPMRAGEATGIQLRYGVASAPEDAQAMEMLLAAAQKAKESANK